MSDGISEANKEMYLGFAIGNLKKTALEVYESVHEKDRLTEETLQVLKNKLLDAIEEYERHRRWDYPDLNHVRRWLSNRDLRVQELAILASGIYCWICLKPIHLKQITKVKKYMPDLENLCGYVT
jgi:hypothetical protein